MKSTPTLLTWPRKYTVFFVICNVAYVTVVYVNIAVYGFKCFIIFWHNWYEPQLDARCIDSHTSCNRNYTMTLFNGRWGIGLLGRPYFKWRGQHDNNKKVVHIYCRVLSVTLGSLTKAGCMKIEYMRRSFPTLFPSGALLHINTRPPGGNLRPYKNQFSSKELDWSYTYIGLDERFPNWVLEISWLFESAV